MRTEDEKTTVDPDEPITLWCRSGRGKFTITYSEWRARGRGPVLCPCCGKTHDYGQSDLISAAGRKAGENL